ncbi:MAG TPA: T9SS type A sorting domain-containing protein [Flavobacterium sp.]|nr:T9SS type A sorting domain-containing protein [Flavobacterium sp.]
MNSVDKRLELASNGFNNNEYLLVGTNNENTNWIKQGDTELLDSSWLIQSNAKANLNTLKFHLGGNLHQNGVYELVVNPTASNFVIDENVVRYQGKLAGNQLIFENVLFDTDGNGFDTFGITYSAKAKETSRPEIVNKAEIKAYPNPANLNEKVQIAYHFDEPTNLNIHVFTIDGKFIAKQEVNNTTNYQFETSFTASGVYLVVSTYSGQVHTNRIVVK